jgi:hypothetical protein
MTKVSQLMMIFNLLNSQVFILLALPAVNVTFGADVILSTKPR